MNGILLGIFSGAVLPIVMLVVKRHYDSNPNAWEEVFVGVCLGLASGAIGVWLVSLDVSEEGSWADLIVGIVGMWCVLIGLGALFVSFITAREAATKTRGDQD